MPLKRVPKSELSKKKVVRKKTTKKKEDPKPRSPKKPKHPGHIITVWNSVYRNFVIRHRKTYSMGKHTPLWELYVILNKYFGGVHADEIIKSWEDEKKKKKAEKLRKAQKGGKNNGIS